MAVAEPKLVRNGKRRLNALTTLRFLAAMHVVLFHCAPTLAGRTAERLTAATAHSPAMVREIVALLSRAMIEIMNAGPWSVSFFFILSGFILVYNYEDERRSLDVPRFWVARFARIYPVYLIGFLLAMPFVLEAVRQTHGHGTHHALTGGLLAATLVQSWVPRYAIFWNIPAWSLSVEAFFYLLFPFILIHLRRFAGLKALVAIILGCWVVSIAKDPAIQTMAGILSRGDASRSADVVTAIERYFPLCRLPEFIAGMALGRIMLIRGGAALRGASLLTLASMGAIGLMAALGAARPQFLNASGAMSPLFVLVIWSLTNEESALAKILTKGPLVFFGEASYSIYILHLPLFAIWAIATMHLIPHSSSSANLGTLNYLLPAVFVAGMLCVCGLIYRYIEVPVRDLIRSGYIAWVRPITPLEALEPTAT
jgi:peptidoglycan/LPS O-acetylase OafA/YrhL